MEITKHQAKYYAYEITKRFSSDTTEKFTASLSEAQVRLTPHQIDAAYFAFRSPFSKGAILADEVGLGKTIEAGIILSQKWAERKKKLLIICPANLRKQWSQELIDKFFIDSKILESASFNKEIKAGNLNPFIQKNAIVICSYPFARSKAVYLEQTGWDLVVMDEAHRLRNVYKKSHKTGNAIKDALKDYKKILLTATPLQNTLLELFGLVSLIDEYVFGDIRSFKAKFSRLTGDDNFDDLKERLNLVCQRTLRRQVTEYVKYTNRIAITEEYFPREDEAQLYELVTNYLHQAQLYALPTSQRHLMTLILRKLLASSTYAISGTLEKLANKLQDIVDGQEIEQEEEEFKENLSEDYETYGELKEEWDEEEDEKVWYSPHEIDGMQSEIVELRKMEELAKSINKNSKGEKLITALEKGFEKLEEIGAAKKAIIFTESRRTQDYLKETLESNGYEGEIVLFNGSNTDAKSKEVYKEWLEKHKNTNRISGSRTSDKRAAIVEEFKDRATILIATEAAAEGINLQFCSLVVNYDLPWNPQRIEQRIGRCHRFGQKFDVVVVNFLNRKNAADVRVFQLLSLKFKLFEGVFGASDEVLGSIESGVDFEKRIAEIYQNCRAETEIQEAFDQLQSELSTSIEERMKKTRRILLENFDEEVHKKLKGRLKDAKDKRDEYQKRLWKLTRFYLKDYAHFKEEDDEYTFKLHTNPFSNEDIFPGPYKMGKNETGVNIYRTGNSLAKKVIENCKKQQLEFSKLSFSYSSIPKISIIEDFVGKSGWMIAKQLTISTFEDEDHILLFGVSEDGTQLDDEQCRKIFSINVTDSSTSEIVRPSEVLFTKMEEKYVGQKNVILEGIGNRNSKFFEVELDKLDRWSEDRRNSLKINLKELDMEIKDIKKKARLANNLPEKLSFEKKRRKLESSRDEAWREYDAAAKEIEKNKDLLIENIEKSLKESTSEEELFFIQWELKE